MNSVPFSIPRRAYWSCILAGGAGALAALVFFCFFVYLFIDVSFISDAQCGDLGSTRYCFFDKDWDSSTYLSTITSFYSTLITVIVGFLAVVAAFAFLVIRSSARHHAQDAMEMEVQRFFQTASSVERISEEVRSVSRSVLTEELGRQLALIQGDIETIIAVLEEGGFEMPGRIEVRDETKA